MTQHEKTALVKVDRELRARGLVLDRGARNEVAALAIQFESFWKHLDYAVVNALDLILALRGESLRKTA